jgi:hypothetical protein
VTGHQPSGSQGRLVRHERDEVNDETVIGDLLIAWPENRMQMGFNRNVARHRRNAETNRSADLDRRGSVQLSFDRK